MANNTPARGERNCNPGNIRIGKDQWQGLADDQTDPDFYVFRNAAYGIRAIARVLITYQDKHRSADGSAIDTVREIIDRWAPPTENNTESYVKSVCAYSDLQPDTEMNVHNYEDCARIVGGIIHHELGYMPYSKTTLDAGLRLAGVLPPVAPVSTTPTGHAAAITGAAGAATAIASAVQDASPAIPLLQDMLHKAPIIFGILVVMVAAYLIYSKLRERREAGEL